MHRRSVLAIGATVVLAGCNELGLGGDLLIDESVSSGSPRQFSASEGDEVEIEIEVEEVDDEEIDEGDETAQGQESVSVQIQQNGEVLLAESVEGQQTFEREVPVDGEYNVAVSGGTAHVRAEVI